MTGFPTFEIFLQILINGVLYGSMYGVAAIGLSLIFGSMEIIFIAQGAMMILASYFSYWLFTTFNIDPFISIILCVPLFAVIGWVVYTGLFQKVAKAGKNPSLLMAFGMMIMLENLMSVLWTPNVRAIRASYTGKSFYIGELMISYTRLMVFIVGILATAIVFLFLKKTLLGKAVRGACEDMRAATLLAISPLKVSGVTFAVGIGLAGVAGAATAATYPFDPFFGFVFSLKALIAVALGGIGSIVGAFLGGILLGVIENLSSFVFGGGWADGISYAVFLLVLMFRPEGFFGRSVVKA